MKQFNYRALDKEGKPAMGVIEALGDKQAVRALQERGMTVVSLVEKKDWKARIFGMIKIGSRVSGRDVAVFTRLLATMLSTGLPLVDALSNLTTQVNGYFREVIRSVQNDVRAGMALSVAMARFPEVFGNLYVNLVKAGEASGKVGEVLNKLADTLEGSLDFKAKMKGAMVYPIIIVTVMTGIGIFMMSTIIPQIADVYKDFQSELPTVTKILINFSLFLRNYFWLAIILVGLGVVGYRILRKNEVSDFLINNALYQMPVFGSLRQDVTLAILNRTLGTLLGSGVAIVDSLRIVAATMENDHYRAGVEASSRAVEKGIPLSLSFRRNPIFPVIISQLVAIGEETGTLDQGLLRLATYYEQSAERKVKVVTTAMEPLLILLMGLMVGGLAIAVLLPMFNLVNVIK